MTGSYVPDRRAFRVGGRALAALLLAGCGGVDSQVTTAAVVSDPDRGSVVARLERERDDANHRALDSQQFADRARGECQLVQHELEALRVRDSFEESMWYRLGQAEITERGVRERASPGPRLRPARDAGLKAADGMRDSIERAMREVHSVSDARWARFAHDLETAADDLDRELRDLP